MSLHLHDISGVSIGAERLLSAITRVLAQNELCSMATVSPGSAAHIHTAFFAWTNELELVFLSDPHSTHAQYLETASTMAVTVFDSRQRWGADHRGLQLFGACYLAEGAALSAARTAYSQRFPAYLDQAASLHALSFYVFTPHTITLLDESEFGPTVFITARLARTK